VLDCSQEEVIEHLRKTTATAIERGFRYLKLDFMFAGALPGAHKNPGAVHEIYRHAVDVLTEKKQTADGKPVFYLGCGIPLELSYRNFPLSRIGADTMEHWDHPQLKWLRFPCRPGAQNAMRDILGRSFLNHALFINDPDVVFMRSTLTSHTDRERILIAVVAHAFASQIMTSDASETMIEGRDVEFTKNTFKLLHQLENDEYSPLQVRRDVYIMRSRSKRICGFINLTSKKQTLKRADLEHRLDLDAL